MYIRRFITLLTALMLTLTASLTAAETAKEGAIRQIYYPKIFRSLSQICARFGQAGARFQC